MKKLLSLSGSFLTIMILAALILSSCATGPSPAELIRAQEQWNLEQMDLWRSFGFVKKEVQVDSDRIVYMDGGQGETVLLLHGFACNKEYRSFFAKYLTGEYHVVIPDLPGFGESTKRHEENYTIDNQMKRFGRFANALGLERFHLAGNSMGGTIAAVYAAKNLRRISTLALLDPWRLKTTKAGKSEMEAIDCLGIRSAGEMEKCDPYFFVKPPPSTEVFKKAFVAQAIAAKGYNEQILWQLFKEDFALEPFLPMIQAPVCIIWGDQDRICDVSGASVLEKGLKNHQTIILKDTGHFPMIGKPAETAEAYVNFLKNHS
jgi:pimeloyl-ACP methyl ester carboxylesterase